MAYVQLSPIQAVLAMIIAFIVVELLSDPSISLVWQLLFWIEEKITGIKKNRYNAWTLYKKSREHKKLRNLLKSKGFTFTEKEDVHRD